MPRPRSKENRALPSRWRWQHGALYYLVPDHESERWDGKKWFRLGKTLAEAHRTFSERIHKHGAKVLTVRDLLDRFEFEHLPTLKLATQKYYLNALPVLRKVFTTTAIPVDQVEAFHGYQMMDHVTRTKSSKQARQCMEALSSAYSCGVRWGVVKTNPFKGQVRKPAANSRTRAVGDDELVAFGELLPRKWQLYISLKLHTKGRRKGELLRLKHSDLRDEGIRFTNNKRQSDSFIIPWTPVLRQIVQEIIDIHPPRVGDSPLFFGRGFKPYIDENGVTSGFDSIWQRYMRKAVESGICERFTEHDIRAKAVEKLDLDTASRLLRHTSKAVTQRHYRRGPEVLD